MPRLVGRKSFAADEMPDTGPRHNDFNGQIIEVKFSVFDYAGSQFADGGTDYGLHIAAYVTFKYVNDNGETVIFTEPYNAGKLKYMITSNGTEDADARESDIDWPGDPIAPDPDDPSAPFGIDLVLVKRALEEVWTEAKDRDEYKAAIVEKWGGKYPFGIGKGDNLTKGKWAFFGEKAEALMGEDYDGETADELYRGVTGQFLRLPPPEKKQSAAAKMLKQGEKITAKHILAMVNYEGKKPVEGEVEEKKSEKATSKKSDGRKTDKKVETNKPSGEGTVEQVVVGIVCDLADDRINDDGLAEFDLTPKTNPFKQLIIGKEVLKEYDGKFKAKAWKLVTRDAERFFGDLDVEGYDFSFDDGKLMVTEA